MLTGSEADSLELRRRKTWTFVNTIAVGSFYEVALDDEKPYHICGGLQDNGAGAADPDADARRDCQ